MDSADALSLAQAASAKANQSRDARNSIYQDLRPREIRILCLSPGQSGSPLIASLEVADLDAAETDSSYEAISYAWGEAIFSKTLTVGDERSLAITPSLWSALQHLRYESRIRRLWADAVCIDQQDVSERSAQVASMFDVYAKASRVLVWLGDGEEPDKVTFSKLAAAAELRPHLMRVLVLGSRDLGDLARRLWNKSDLSFCTLHDEVEQSDAASRECSHCGLKPLTALFNRSWFSRLWVAQEAAAAKSTELWCGRNSISWTVAQKGLDFLYRFAVNRRLSRELDLTPREWQHLTALRHVHETLGGNRIEVASNTEKSRFCGHATLARLLSLAPRRCSEPHDRIYAVRHLLGLDAFPTVEVDYDLPVAQVYTRFLDVCLQHKIYRRGRDRAPVAHMPYISFALAIAGLEHHTMQHSEASPETADWPTWLADFNRIDQIPKVKRRMYYSDAGAQLYRASTVRFRAEFERPACRVLKVKGRACGSVQGVFAMDASYDENFGTVRDVYPLNGLQEWCRQEHATGNSLSHNTWITMDADITELLACGEEEGVRFGHLYNLDPPETHQQSHNPFAAGNPPNEPTGASDNHSPPSQTPAHDQILRRSIALILTPSGPRLAWVPAITRQNDALCFFSGTPYPWIVRSHPQDNGSHQLIGDAWVHNLPEWQAMGMDRQTWASLDLGGPGRYSSFWVPEAEEEDDDYDGEVVALVSGDERRVAQVSRYGTEQRRKQKGRECMLAEWEEENMGWVALR